MTDAEILPRHFRSYYQSRLLIGVLQGTDGCDEMSGGCKWKIVKVMMMITSFRVPSEAQSVVEPEHASTPPRGWNSYNSFCWTISEEEFLQSAEIISNRLKPHGYEHVVVHYLWYRRKLEGAYADSQGFDVKDEWGRLIPDPERWPSSKSGKGFSEVAKKVHSMGLKFGVHVMRGLSLQAFNANTPILDTVKGSAYEESGRQWTAKDIGLKERACAWMSHGFISANTKLEAGRAFLRSLYLQYAEWGVDFVKHDCAFGDDLDIDEISFVSEGDIIQSVLPVLRKLDRPILYSLSPGTSVTPAMAKDVSGLVNMYRITRDDWDTWRDVVSHFDISRDFSTYQMIGAKGLLGRSWPDLDMSPLGWLTDPGSNEGPHRTCNLNLDEQRTQMTLWAMAKSPLMFGGDVRNLDEATYNLITNPTLLEINSFSLNNMEELWVLLPARILKHMGGQLKLLTKILNKSAGKRNWRANLRKHRAFTREKLFWLRNYFYVSLLACFLSFFVTYAIFYSMLDNLFRGEEMIYKQKYQGTLHLLVSDGMELCLDASPRRRLTSKELGVGSLLGSYKIVFKSNASILKFSDVELNANGVLVNSYSGLCATVDSLEGDTFGQIRAPNLRILSYLKVLSRFNDLFQTFSVEIFLAFFNLNPEKDVISANIADLAKVLPWKILNGTSCKYDEIWSGNFGVAKQLISIAVERHSCTLFVLLCD
ncbi:uncharacterized protein LOC111289010 [Durio zibethinus]|uniref:Alpha-galactosidase n=1 Tax=Durio zibethinus TaxID=66656 RepID=A0A6P5Y5B8_DURZI|nr:uncharacterized protein LOC111289010 [Durio zibethinus]